MHKHKQRFENLNERNELKFRSLILPTLGDVKLRKYERLAFIYDFRLTLNVIFLFIVHCGN